MISIETKNGELISSPQLIQLVPGNIFNSKTHVETCIMLGSKAFPHNDDKNKIFVNLLMRQSNAAKSITALKFLLLQNVVQCKTLYISEMLRNKIDDDFFADISREYINNCSNLIDRVSTKNLLLKSIAHRIYRIAGWKFKRKASKHSSLVRCYVEVSETIHKNEMASSLCVFFPFPFKISRQINFYKSCLKRGYDTALYGVPYSLWSAFKLIFRKNDISMVNFEYKAYQAHAIELARLNTKHYYTEDDYVAASFLVGKKLQESGCKVVNRSHGVGLDCPFIYTNVFDVLTKPQIEYYKYWNEGKNIQFNIQKRPIQPVNSLVSQSDEICYIFMHSNFKDHQLHYEGKLQEEIIKALSFHAEHDNYDIMIKYHPNTSIKEDVNLPEINNVDSINKIKVFITINSASFYSYLHLGLFIFIGDDLCNPFNLIDENVLFYNINQIKLALSTYQNKSAIASALQLQHEILRSINDYESSN